LGLQLKLFSGGNDTSKAKYWCLIFLMQWKPIANKYRKGMMKSTLQARVLSTFKQLFLICKFIYIL